MKRRILLILLVFVLLLTLIPVATLSAQAISGVPTSWKAPSSLSARADKYETILMFSVDSALLKFIDEDQTDYDALGIDSIGHTAQIDWKLNDGVWHYSSAWDKPSGDYAMNTGVYINTGYLSVYATDEKRILDLRNDYDETTPLQIALEAAMLKASDSINNRLDLVNNTFQFRVRLLVSYNITETNQESFILSPWSEILVYGKNSTALTAPTFLTKPTLSDQKVGKNTDGSPNITFTAITPKQVMDANNYYKANNQNDITVEHQININNTGWVAGEAGVWWLADETRSISVPTTYDNGKTVDIATANIQVRMRYRQGNLLSEWSNIVAVNTPAWSKSSGWSVSDLTRADELGLIPIVLRGSDMTKSITREEFAELSVLLCESVMGVEATPKSPNPFKDSTNVRVLKAVTLGITDGTSPTTFSPLSLITRQDCATMLFRALKAITPKGNFSTVGAPVFKDQSIISGYALDAVKYMSKLEIIKGSNGFFRPRGITEAEKAAGYGMASREAAIVMSLRSYDVNMK